MGTNCCHLSATTQGHRFGKIKHLLRDYGKRNGDVLFLRRSFSVSMGSTAVVWTWGRIDCYLGVVDDADFLDRV